MTNKIKNICLSVLVVLLAVFTFGAISLNSASAETLDESVKTFAMQDGVYLKLGEVDGMRFTVGMDDDTYQFVKGEGIDLYFLITTKEIFDGCEGDYSTITNKVEIKVDEEKAFKSSLYGEGALWCFNGCLTEIQVKNRKVELVATAYITDGENSKFATVADNSRVLYDVVNTAFLSDSAIQKALVDTYNFYGSEEYPVVIETDEQYINFVNAVNNTEIVNDNFTFDSVVVSETVDTTKAEITNEKFDEEKIATQYESLAVTADFYKGEEQITGDDAAALLTALSTAINENTYVEGDVIDVTEFAKGIAPDFCSLDIANSTLSATVTEGAVAFEIVYAEQNEINLIDGGYTKYFTAITGGYALNAINYDNVNNVVVLSRQEGFDYNYGLQFNKTELQKLFDAGFNTITFNYVVNEIKTEKSNSWFAAAYNDGSWKYPYPDNDAKVSVASADEHTNTFTLTQAMVDGGLILNQYTAGVTTTLNSVVISKSTEEPGPSLALGNIVSTAISSGLLEKYPIGDFSVFNYVEEDGVIAMTGKTSDNEFTFNAAKWQAYIDAGYTTLRIKFHVTAGKSLTGYNITKNKYVDDICTGDFHKNSTGFDVDMEGFLNLPAGYDIATDGVITFYIGADVKVEISELEFVNPNA